MSITEWLKAAAHQLRLAGIEGGQTDAEVLLAHVLGHDRAWLLGHGDDRLPPTVQASADTLLSSRADRNPLSYVLGHREFAGLDFLIDDRALTPRVETETIVIEVAKRAPQQAQILDIGTGSGAMAIALAHLRPDLNVTASEVSADALDLARENAKHLLKAEHSITFIESDLFTKISGTFDGIVANLPYVAPTMELMPEVQAEPDVALFGGADDGLDLYRTFFREVPPFLNHNGQIWIESDPWQQPALIALAQEIGLHNIYQDYFILGFCSLV